MYALRPPAAALRRFVEHYWFVTPDDGPVDLRVDVFVDARADLIFNFGAPYTREIIGGAASSHHASNLDAQRLVPIRILQRGMVRTTGVRFHLGGLGPFVRAPLRPWTNTTPSVDAVLGAAATRLDRELAGLDDLDAQAAALDRFLLDQLVLDEGLAVFSRGLERLVEGDGNHSVESVAGELAVSTRQLDRLFARYLGIAPKAVAKVLRFQRTLRALMRDPKVTLAEVAADAGYFDQAHFIKDFKRMTGGVPRGYRGYYPKQAPEHFAPNVVVFVRDAEAEPSPSTVVSRRPAP
ncbi:MAG: AraC family transcriptional regulator [Deltaproteobacteria bacterium]|nr:AraC family transcriptional regulator [Deltaproteobacteria bacterium]MBK8715168.1 AraC family transcriptional regulator [Deltaproteobacteria bacterium]MBP7285127.1 AraC family transcriptional regulator [Nannocystaceae bacterium]